MSPPRLNARLVALAAACVAMTPASGHALGPAKWDSGDPSPAEQHVLEMINRARADPAAEGQRLGIDINEGVTSGTAVQRPPLAMNKILLGTARTHSDDMYARKYFAHSDPDGKDPYQRMTEAGYAGVLYGENIAAGSGHTAAALEDLLMRDPNYPGRGHRVNLLNIGGDVVYSEIGIGYSTNATPLFDSPTVFGMKDFITEDFGAGATGPFVLGVVYADANANGSYDPGEGLGGVTVMPSGGEWYAVTSAAGGYAFPVAASGAIDVTASGGTLPSPVTAHVVLTGVNVKVDFLPGAASGGASSDSLVDTDGDGFPDEIETAVGTAPDNAGDTPTGGTAAAPLPLRLPRVGIRLDFTTPAHDRLTFSCRFPVADDFAVDGAMVLVDVGGVVRSFTLDAHGRGVGTAPRTVHLTVRRLPAGRVAQLDVRLSKDSVAAALADEGLLNTTTHGTAHVAVPAIVLAGGGYFTATKTLRYAAKVGKSGAAK
jgi:hypothetical protein